MKAFTIFNIIAQPSFVLIGYFGKINDNVDVLFICFIAFCILQITHFIVRILPPFRKNSSLNISEMAMLLYILILMITSIVFLTNAEGRLNFLFILLGTGIISAVSNYIALVGYYQFVNTK